MTRRRALALPPPDRAVLRRKGVLAAHEAAAYIGASVRQLRRWRQPHERGGPPFIRLSPNSVVYDTRDLDAWLAARRIPC